MLKRPISITAINSVSPLGNSLDVSWESYRQPISLIAPRKIGNRTEWAGSLKAEILEEIRVLEREEPRYTNLDNSVKYALLASRHSLKMAGWEIGSHFGINIGSSRGATTLFENYHREFLEEGRTSVLSSPTTTLGNISSWVAHDLQAKGPEISHSITCSTALHSLLNGIAWIYSGMADKFMVGGSEAPLTPFTVAQMRALKIYAPPVGKERNPFPSRALDLQKSRNTMCLGEGASMACLEMGVPSNSLAIVEGVGYATEPLEHNASLSADAMCLQRSMKMALGQVAPEMVDVVVMHAPGTVKGDQAEYQAVKNVFGRKPIAITGNKWKIGHTFGASGMLSIELAVHMLMHQEFIPVPFIDYSIQPTSINRVLVNAVGFGGNAVSILLRKK